MWRPCWSAELFTVALGTLKAGGILCSLFSAFGPEPLKTRLQLGHARVLVTSEVFYRRKVMPIRAALPQLRYVLLIREERRWWSCQAYPRLR